MKILISNTSDTPLYQQIKDQIKDAILKEELVEGAVEWNRFGSEWYERHKRYNL